LLDAVALMELVSSRSQHVPHLLTVLGCRGNRTANQSLMVLFWKIDFEILTAKQRVVNGFSAVGGLLGGLEPQFEGLNLQGWFL
jgi:hypothetical protein